MSYTVDQFGPSDLLTTKKVGTRRIKTDQGTTSFYEGREFYVFKEFDIAPETSEAIKVVSLGDTIVQTFSATLVLGQLRVELVTGGTEADPFTNTLPIFPVNSMSESPGGDPTVVITNGGTHSGGTIADLLLLNSGSPASQARASSASEPLPLGFSAGTFYIRLINTSATSDARGLFRARWEER